MSEKEKKIHQRYIELFRIVAMLIAVVIAGISITEEWGIYPALAVILGVGLPNFIENEYLKNILLFAGVSFFGIIGTIFTLANQSGDLLFFFLASVVTIFVTTLSLHE